MKLLTRVHYFSLILLICLDQLTKQLAEHKLRQSLVLIKDMVSFDLVHNSGAAYGILQNQKAFLLSITVIVLVGCIIFKKYIVTSKWSAWSWVFLLAGAIGNGTDRLIFSYVIDFINIRIFPVFNFADIYINIAMGCFLIEILIESNVNQKMKKRVQKIKELYRTKKE